MANATISQITIGSNTYDICDATSRNSVATAQNSINTINNSISTINNSISTINNKLSYHEFNLTQSTYFTAGAGGTLGDTFYCAIFGRVTSLNAAFSTKNDITIGKAEGSTSNNYGDFGDTLLATVKSSYTWLIPRETTTFGTYNKDRNGFISSAGNVYLSGTSHYWGTTYTMDAGTGIQVTATYVNKGFYS